MFGEVGWSPVRLPWARRRWQNASDAVAGLTASLREAEQRGEGGDSDPLTIEEFERVRQQALNVREAGRRRPFRRSLTFPFDRATIAKLGVLRDVISHLDTYGTEVVTGAVEKATVESAAAGRDILATLPEPVVDVVSPMLEDRLGREVLAYEMGATTTRARTRRTRSRRFKT